MIIYAAINNYLADIPIEEIKKFEVELFEFMDVQHQDIGKAIKNSGTLTEDTELKLKDAIIEFKKLRERAAF